MRHTLVTLSLTAALALAASAVELIGPPAPEERPAGAGLSAVEKLHAETQASIDQLLAGRELDDQAQQQVQELKFQEELTRLQLLAEHFRRQGNQEQAEQAERELERLQQPRKPGSQPVTRDDLGIIRTPAKEAVVTQSSSDAEVTQ